MCMRGGGGLYRKKLCSSNKQWGGGFLKVKGMCRHDGNIKTTDKKSQWWVAEVEQSNGKED